MFDVFLQCDSMLTSVCFRLHSTNALWLKWKASKHSMCSFCSLLISAEALCDLMTVISHMVQCSVFVVFLCQFVNVFMLSILSKIHESSTWSLIVVSMLNTCTVYIVFDVDCFITLTLLVGRPSVKKIAHRQSQRALLEDMGEPACRGIVYVELCQLNRIKSICVSDDDSFTLNDFLLNFVFSVR